MIRLLDKELISKISAGEVIERPASVVKELVENSLDASADEIRIEIKNAGIKGIRVKDNGAGMSKDDALLCLQRHTTSKIASEKDLEEVMTLGFRGEALASINEVSNTIIRTNTGSQGIEIQDGRIQSVGMRKGTEVIVNDLFANIPARRKFLKSPSTENGHIIDIVTRYALNHPEIYFHLTIDDKEVLVSPKTDFSNNIVSIYGKDIAKDLVKIEGTKNGISLQGFVSKPKLTRNTKDFQSIYINGRYVKNTLISRSVYEGYGNLLFHGRHPVFVLTLKIPPHEVDVNVHPAKTEVKLSREQSVKDAIVSIIGEFIKDDPVPDYTEPEIKKYTKKNYGFSKETQYELLREDAVEYDFTVHGQINRTYILVEKDEGLVIVDQHAAEERINFEKYMNAYKENSIKTQRLLEPLIIEPSPKEANTIAANITALEKLGFEVEEFGPNSFRLASSPVVLSRQYSKELFFDLINNFSDLDSLTYDKLATKSCKASIKAGDSMSFSQMKELVYKLMECETPYTCPHGRPTMIKFRNYELEKMFKRVV